MIDSRGFETIQKAIKAIEMLLTSSWRWCLTDDILFTFLVLLPGVSAIATKSAGWIFLSRDNVPASGPWSNDPSFHVTDFIIRV